MWWEAEGQAGCDEAVEGGVLVLGGELDLEGEGVEGGCLGRSLSHCVELLRRRGGLLLEAGVE